MKTLAGHFIKRFDRLTIERDVEEELRLHLEMLTWEHQQQGMSPGEARDAALKRFGNVGEIKDQCIEITKRRNPLIRALKSLLILMFIAGVLVRVFTTESHFMRVGDMLILISAMTRMFLYLRTANPASFRPRPENSVQLKLNEKTST